MATVFVPAAWAEDVRESGRPVAKSVGTKFLRSERGKAVLEVLAGRYVFESRLNGP
jgi:hypothetical protein